MPHPPFAPWPSIQRLSSETVFITEKIDGTNGVLYVPEDSAAPTIAGSRSRWLTAEDGTPPGKGGDNFGFGQWVHQHSDGLRALGPGYHYGEWHGNGIQRQYGLKDKRFTSFEYWRDDLPACMSKVPLLYSGPFHPNLFDEWITTLCAHGSYLYPGWMKPEGIVISFKNERSAKFKKLCENDLLHKYQVPQPSAS